MGRAIIVALQASRSLRLSGALTIPSDPDLGADAGEKAGVGTVGVALTDDYHLGLDRAQVAIDFTLPGALEANLRACESAGCPIVIGTTGLGERHIKALESAARQVPVVYARNMSVGVNVFMEFVARAARALGEDYDVEIIEAHHRQKVDAPSGTALAIGERIAEQRGHKLDELAVRGRDGRTGPRVPGTIGFSVLRGGNIVGEHEVRFISPDERLSFRHEAVDRRTFASGALRAAQWVAGRAPGLYSMADVLGLARQA
jgi:4-hydroxy-tetrahydrodipicolinate reductase